MQIFYQTILDLNDSSTTNEASHRQANYQKQNKHGKP